jgi:hypothetical protein
MERRGLIRREGSADDSRGAEIVMREAGATAFHGATVPHLRAIRTLFVDALTPAQISAAGEIAAALRRHLPGHPGLAEQIDTVTARASELRRRRPKE